MSVDNMFNFRLSCLKRDVIFLAYKVYKNTQLFKIYCSNFKLMSKYIKNSYDFPHFIHA